MSRWFPTWSWLWSSFPDYNCHTQVARQVESTECKQVPRQNEVRFFWKRIEILTKKKLRHSVTWWQVENCRDIERQVPRTECENVPKNVCENIPKQVGQKSQPEKYQLFLIFRLKRSSAQKYREKTVSRWRQLSLLMIIMIFTEMIELFKHQIWNICRRCRDSNATQWRGKCVSKWRRRFVSFIPVEEAPR